MKKLFTLIIIIILSIYCFAMGESVIKETPIIMNSSDNIKDTNNIQLMISQGKNKYILKENITVSASIHVTGESEMVLNTRFLLWAENLPKTARELYFKVSSSDCDEFRMNVFYNMSPHNINLFESIAGGRKLAIPTVSNFDVSSLMFLQGKNKYKSIAEIPGYYTVQLVYENLVTYDSKPDIWVGRVISNVLEFEVIE